MNPHFFGGASEVGTLALFTEIKESRMFANTDIRNKSLAEYYVPTT